jgi:hypothetical protein
LGTMKGRDGDFADDVRLQDEQAARMVLAELHAARGRFLSIAISVESMLRAALADYFDSDIDRQDLFCKTLLNDRVSLGTIVDWFLQVVADECERGNEMIPEQTVSALRTVLKQLTHHRNRFAHDEVPTYL